MCKYYVFILAFVICNIIFNRTFAQRQSFIGLDAIGEWSGATFHPGVGAVVEHRFTKNSGVESGLFYKNYRWNGIITINTGNGSSSFPFQIAEHYLSVPLLYKYYTRLVNVSVGPTVDYYVGFSHKNKSSAFSVNSYDVTPRLSLGLLVKVSSSFPLNKSLLLEPAIRLSTNISYERFFSGVSAALKYKLK